MRRLLFLLVFLTPVLCFSADLTDFSIDELAELDVTTVSKKPQKVMQTPASIFVLTGEEIMRSGVTSVPEALRLVPGLQVARIDGNKWAITSRSFNSYTSNKLLVLVDGRSVYTNLFTGVFWDTQEFVMEDIDRIEIIKGPGAAVWGVNAVNGVINIITKSASETLGGLVSLNVSNLELIESVRFGANLGEGSDMRLYMKHRKSSDLEDGEQEANDSNKLLTGGFRYDWKRLSQSLSLSGDIYHSTPETTFKDFSNMSPVYTPKEYEADVDGGNLMLNYHNNMSVKHSFSFHAYFSETDREDYVFSFRERSYDIELKDTFYIGKRNNISIGAGYRLIEDELRDTTHVAYDDHNISSEIYNIYLQDDITLMQDKLFLTVGGKLEHLESYGWETQPTARLLFMPDMDNSIWLAYSRASRLPSVTDVDGNVKVRILQTQIIPSPFPLVLYTKGSPDIEPEEVETYEGGYKTSLLDNVYLEFSAFYNKYTKLRSGSQDASTYTITPNIPHSIQVESSFINGQAYDTYGFELQGDYIPLERLKLTAWYAYVDYKEQEGVGYTMPIAEYDSKHNAMVSGAYGLTEHTEVSAWYRYASALEHFNINNSSHISAQISHCIRDGMKISAGVHNITGGSHQEFVPMYNIYATQIPRTFYAAFSFEY